MHRPAGREHAYECHWEWRGGGPTAAPVETQCGQPQPCKIKLQKGHSKILCKTLPLETFIQFSHLNSHLAKTSVWP